MACACSSEGCCCGPSWSKSVQIISVVDLLMSIIFVTYETANFGILTGLLKPLADRNCSNCTDPIQEFIPEHIKTSFNMKTFTVMTLIGLIFIGFIIEGALYSKLKTGKRLRVHLFVKKWFEWRIVLFLITIFMAAAKVVRGVYTPYFDGVVDGITKTYRIITLFVVKCFMKEVEQQYGVVYIKPPKPRKRGSLSVK